MDMRGRGLGYGQTGRNNYEIYSLFLIDKIILFRAIAYCMQRVHLVSYIKRRIFFFDMNMTYSRVNTSQFVTGVVIKFDCWMIYVCVSELIYGSYSYEKEN